VVVEIAIFSNAGVVIADSHGQFTLNPGISTEVQTNETYTGFAYCDIYLPSEAGSTVRANLTVFHGTGAFFENL
jgi:hypothetical protein